MSPRYVTCLGESARTLLATSVVLVAAIVASASSVQAQGTDSCTTPQVIAGAGPFAIDNTAAAAGQNFAPTCVPTHMQKDVWFTWTAPASGNTTVSLCSGVSFDTVLAVYNGSTCPGAASIGCSDDACLAQSSVTFTAVAAQSYAIQIGGYDGDFGSGTFTIAGATPPPANDDCSMATAISGTGLFPFNNTTATTGSQGQAESLCNFFTSTAIARDVWFAWTAPSTGIATVQTCSQTTVDTKMSAFSGAGCPASASIACNDDACSLQSSIQFACTSGSVYMLQVGTYPFASSGGSGNLNITVGAPALKLSQVYGAGGNAQTPLFSDYIEVYNPGPVAQPLAGWSVQYASATGVFSAANTTALPNVTLGAGKYLLINEGTGATLPAGQVPNNPTGDASGAIAIAATDFKVALVSSTTFLPTGLPTYAANPTLVDFVGAGTTANWNDNDAAGAVHVIANNAPAANSVGAIYRSTCGSIDTNSSKDDWAVAFPAPRNISTVANTGLAVIGSALPLTPKAGQIVRLTATPFRCATSDLLSGTTMNVDLTLVGGAAANAMLDDGVAPDEVANDGLFTAVVTIGGATTSASYSLPVTATQGATTGGSYISVFVEPAATPDNDNCSTPQAILSLPATIAGTFTGATVETNPLTTAVTAPTSGMSTRRGLWYSVIGTGNSMTASLCASTPSFDSDLFVLGGTCDGLTDIVNNDDNGPACTGAQASASWCSALGATYYIWISPLATGASTLAFVLNVTDGAPCGTAFPVTICTGVSGPFTETEPGYGTATNDGCDSTPNRFTTIPAPGLVGSVIRGTARGIAGNRDTDWYRFQATATGQLTMSIDSFGAQAQAQLVSLAAGGVCPASLSIANTPITLARCATAQSVATFVTAGTWYAMKVVGGVNLQVSPTAGTVFGGMMPGGTTYQYKLTATFGGPPPNDTCATATTLTLGAASLLGDTSMASPDTVPSCGPSGNDVWYKVTTTAQGTLNVDTCTSAIDTVLTVYASCGGAELGCNDDCGGAPCTGLSSCLTLPGLPAGMYFIRVGDKGAGMGGLIAVKASFLLDNDTCAGAIAISCGQQVPGTTIGATPEVPLPPVCAGPLGTGGQSYTVTATTPGVWFKTTSMTNQTITLDTLLSTYDSRIFVYDSSGGCGALVCVTANDDIQGSPFQSKVAWQAIAGVEYRILVTPFSTTTGNFILNESCAPTPANDSCSTPQALNGINGSVSGTTIGATDVTNTSSSSQPSCDSAYGFFDVWYSYTAACAGTLTVSTCGTYDSLVSIHTTCPTLIANNQIAGACNDNGATGCTPGSSVSTPLAANQTVLIRVAGALGANPGGNFTLTYSLPLTDTDLDGTPDCLDGCPNDPLKIAPGICGCGVADTDSDLDGTPNCNDGCPNDPLKIAPGQCGCGIADTDTDMDGVANCNDGCPSDPAKITPGQCGCGVADTDTDGDTIANCIDNCPNIPNVGQFDADADGRGDACDNCVNIPNPTQGDCDTNGIGDACEIAAGAPDCNMNGIPDTCDIASMSSPDANSNGIPDECELNGGTPYCFGYTGCPCSNNSTVGSGQGCRHDGGVGAILTGSGLTQITMDNLVLTVANLPLPPLGAGRVLFYQGTATAGVVFNDGLRCVGGTQVRIGNKAHLGTTSSYPQGGDMPVHTKGAVPGTGGVRYYQAWYRNFPGACMSSHSNLSNGLSVIWIP